MYCFDNNILIVVQLKIRTFASSFRNNYNEFNFPGFPRISWTQHIFLTEGATSAFEIIPIKFRVLVANADSSDFPTKIFETLFESMMETQLKDELLAEKFFYLLKERTSESEILPYKFFSRDYNTVKNQASPVILDMIGKDRFTNYTQ